MKIEQTSPWNDGMRRQPPLDRFIVKVNRMTYERSYTQNLDPTLQQWERYYWCEVHIPEFKKPDDWQPMHLQPKATICQWLRCNYQSWFGISNDSRYTEMKDAPSPNMIPIQREGTWGWKTGLDEETYPA